MNNDLMKAILSMDAYNRGYDAAISLTGNALGAAQIKQTTIDGIIVNLDSGVIRDPVTQERLDDNIGFYALAYSYNGETVISYRGTDDFDEASDYFSSLDVSNWLLGTGNYLVDQGVMALEFYNAVAGDPSDTRTANISLTGHSLGGGLAGLVGANDNRFSEERDAA